jgi:hypothetical protein
MKLIEIQRMKTLREFRQGDYRIQVKLENPGDEFQEFLKVKIAEGDKEIAKAVFKQWQGKTHWEPLNINITEHSLKGKLRELIYDAAANAGYYVKD